MLVALQETCFKCMWVLQSTLLIMSTNVKQLRLHITKRDSGHVKLYEDEANPSTHRSVRLRSRRSLYTVSTCQAVSSARSKVRLSSSEQHSLISCPSICIVHCSLLKLCKQQPVSTLTLRKVKLKIVDGRLMQMVLQLKQSKAAEPRPLTITALPMQRRFDGQNG